VAKNGSTIETCVDGLWSSTTFSGTVFNGTARFVFGASSGGLDNAEIAFWALCDSALTEPQRAVLVHAMRNRTTVMSTTGTNGDQTIILSGGTLPEALPAWATSDPRKPIAVVNLFGGNYTNATQNNYDNLTGQNKNWFDWAGIFDDPPTEDDLKDWLRGEIDEILAACADFEILFNVPGGRLQDDIFSSYQLSHNTQKQVDALTDIMGEFNLGDGTNGTRRAWFYVGTWPCITEGSYVYDNTAILAARNGGRMNSRTAAFTKPSEQKSHFLDKWAATYGIKCLFCDAAIRNERKFIQLAHDSEVVSAGLRLVGESISYPDIHRAPWFALLHIPKGAPWWNLDAQGVPQRSLGYRATWRVDPTKSRIYFGTQDVADYFNSTPNGENDAGFNNMRVEQVVEFIAKGGLPVAYSRKAKDVGLAWNFVHGYSTAALFKTIQRRRRAARLHFIQRGS
jgi:hypothetical protein